MPWSPAQHRLFMAAAHNKAIAEKHGMSQAQASKMASEGVKRTGKRKGLLSRSTYGR